MLFDLMKRESQPIELSVLQILFLTLSFLAKEIIKSPTAWEMFVKKNMSKSEVVDDDNGVWIKIWATIQWTDSRERIKNTDLQQWLIS